jgi:ABC-type transport system substrate-binding protein
MRVATRAIVALLACALAACGAGSPPPAATPAELIDVLAALPSSLDPAAEQGAAWERVETALAGTLVRPAPRPLSAGTLAQPDAVTPFLATSWRELASGDYVFVLRRGVRSPYGHTLTGADVRFSFALELARSGEARFLARAARIDLRDPVTVLAPRLVRINVSGPSPLTLGMLGDFRFGVLDARAVSAHAGELDAGAWLARHLAFYGPWRLLGFDPASSLLLAANRGLGRRSAFSLVAIEANPSASVRLADVAGAAATQTSGLDWADFAIAAHTSGLQALATPSTATSTLIPNLRVAPLASALVRRMISLALDRRAISRAAYDGLAVPAGPPGGDPARARLGLARAGYPHGFALVLGAGPDTPAAEVAAVAAQLRAAGIAVRVRRASGPSVLAREATSGALGALLETRGLPLDSPALAILAHDLRDSPDNPGAFSSAALERLEPSLVAERAGALAQANAIVDAATPSIALVAVPEQEVARAGVHGYGAYAQGQIYYDQLSG